MWPFLESETQNQRVSVQPSPAQPTAAAAVAAEGDGRADTGEWSGAVAESRNIPMDDDDRVMTMILSQL